MFFRCLVTDRVFGPPTTTRRVYDTAAQQVVSGAMSGINGMFHDSHRISRALKRLLLLV